MKKCPTCSIEYNNNTMFCAECGSRLIAATIKCISCNADLNPGIKFCGFCGSPQKKDSGKASPQQSSQGVNLGDKNVIAGDIISGKEDYNIQGNATFLTNVAEKDEQKSFVMCHVCHRRTDIIKSFQCKVCGKDVCKLHFNMKALKCTECHDTDLAEKKKKEEKLKKEKALQHFNKGKELSDKNEYDKAKVEFDKAVDLDSSLKDQVDEINNSANIFSAFMNSFGGGGFENFGNNQSEKNNNENQKIKDEDLKINITLTLEEIYTGITKKLKYKKYVKCTKCNGSGTKSASAKKKCTTCVGSGSVKQITNSIFGQMTNIISCTLCDGTGEIITDKCTECNGKGRINSEEVVEINVPAGVSEGQYITISGKGNIGIRNNVVSDLITIFKEEKHKIFQRDNNDILYDLELTASEANQGTEKIIPLISGKIKIIIPPNSQSGKLLKIKGKGLPILNDSGTGDMFVRISVI